MTCKICKWANHPPCPKNIPYCDCTEECNSRQCVEPKTETKVCSKCGRELPLTDFYRNKKKGYRSDCKHCVIERNMKALKGEDHQVKHHTEMHEQPKQRKPRVANGQSNRSEYTHQYYLDHKEELKAKNRADYQRRMELKNNVSKPAKAERLCHQCKNWPCFDGIENLESDFANEGCHAFRKRENNDGNN